MKIEVAAVMGKFYDDIIRLKILKEKESFRMSTLVKILKQTAIDMNCADEDIQNFT